MLRFFYKISFEPKFPQPHAESDLPYSYQGDFFLISENEYMLFDINLDHKNNYFNGAPLAAHISQPVQIYLTCQQINDLDSFYREYAVHFYDKFNHELFKRKQCIVLPLVKEAGETDINSLFHFVNSFLNSATIADIYEEILKKHDMKNNGQKLKKFFYVKGDLLNSFIRFITSIDIPIAEFIQCNPIINQNELTKQEIVCIYSALKLQERIFDRAVWSVLLNKFSVSGRPYNHFYVSSLFSFNFHPDMFINHNEKTTYIDFYKARHNFEGIDPMFPLIELYHYREKSNHIELLNQLTSFDQAFSTQHLRLLEILKNKTLINNIYQRIPVDFISTENTTTQNASTKDQKVKAITKIPLEIVHFAYFPRFAGTIVYFLNNIFECNRPLSLEISLPEDITRKAARELENVIGYKFKDLTLLRSSLSDSSSVFDFTKGLTSYQRLEYLGDCVLDIIVSFAAFNANENAMEGSMTKIKHNIVSNETFSDISIAIGLDHMVLSQKPAEYTRGAKKTADIFESLFGAIFRDSNLTTCFKIFQNIVAKKRRVFDKAVARVKFGRETIDCIVNQVADFGMLFVNANDNEKLSLTTDQLKECLGLNFVPEDLPVFKLALTHSSMKMEQSYERLEFIGDVIVKFAIGSALYFGFPTSNEAGLSISSGYYKSNDVLGRASIRLGLENLLFANDAVDDAALAHENVADNQQIFIKKVHGDIFESITAAITIRFGLKVGCDFVVDKVLGKKVENQPDSPKLDPKSEIINITKKNFKTDLQYKSWKFDNNYYIFPSIFDVQLPFCGVSTDPSKAAANMGQLFIDGYQKNPELINQIDESIRQTRKDAEMIKPFYEMFRRENFEEERDINNNV